MTQEIANVLFTLPDCYLVGKTDQLTRRSDITLCLGETNMAYVDFKSPYRLFGGKVRFTGYKFILISDSQITVWWNFRPENGVIQNSIDGVLITWLIDFFTKSASLKLHTNDGFEIKNRFML